MRAVKAGALFLVIVLALLFCLDQESMANTEPDVNLQQAKTAYNHALFNRAIKEYKKLYDRGDIEGYLNLAVIFKDLGCYKKSIEILKKAALKFNEDLRVLSLLGKIYYLNSQSDEAIPVFTRVLKINPEDLDANINLGLCFEGKGNDTEAQKFYEKAITLNKDNLVAHLSLADLYYRKDKLNEAISECRTATLIDASIISIQKLLAEILLKINNLKEALKIYSRIRLAEPENKSVEERLIEIKNKLGKEYLDTERKETLAQRKNQLFFVEPLPVIKNMVFVKVGLMKGKETLEFQSSAQFKITSGPNNIMNGKEAEIYSLSRGESGKIIIAKQNYNGPGADPIIAIENVAVAEGPVQILLSSPQGTITIFNVEHGKNNYWASSQDRAYRGSLEIIAEKDGLKVINKINLEEYLYSVVPSEMPVSWPMEALKAQAVAARTESVSKLGRHKNEGYDFCPEVHCQAYSGIGRESVLSRQAVDETQGIILEFQGKPIDAVYSSNCGGHTQDYIFNPREKPVYFRNALDSLEETGESFPLSPLELEYWLREPKGEILCDIPEYSKNSSFRWVRIYSAQELESMLKNTADTGRIKKIIVLKREKSGHVSAVKIIGSKGSYVLENELKIRNALGKLRSSMFKVETKYASGDTPQEFIFIGGGWGHGVGMCQTGASGMGKKGKDYKEILNHYYQGVEFKKLY